MNCWKWIHSTWICIMGPTRVLFQDDLLIRQNEGVLVQIHGFWTLLMPCLKGKYPFISNSNNPRRSDTPLHSLIGLDTLSPLWLLFLWYWLFLRLYWKLIVDHLILNYMVWSLSLPFNQYQGLFRWFRINLLLVLLVCMLFS